MNKYYFGLALGLILAAVVVMTNVVFPNSAADNGILVGFIYLILFAQFAMEGFMVTKKKDGLGNGAWSGAVSAIITFVIVMETFIIIDKVFFTIVSQQVDKIQAFTNQTTYTNMRDFIDANNTRGLLVGSIMAAIFGGAAGLLGAGIKTMSKKKK